jgi:uncharacterized protein YbaP (TraB family)
MKYAIPVLTTIILLISGCKTPQKSTQATAVVLDKPIATKNSLLWQISGNGLLKPSYLYGTIHIIGEDNYFLGKNVQKKLFHCDELVMELDPAKINVAALTRQQQNHKGLHERYRLCHTSFLYGRFYRYQEVYF